MKHKEMLEEEVEFWLGYINRWKVINNEPVPDRVQLLLENALLKLEKHSFDKNKVLIFQGNKKMIH